MRWILSVAVTIHLINILLYMLHLTQNHIFFLAFSIRWLTFKFIKYCSRFHQVKHYVSIHIVDSHSLAALHHILHKQMSFHNWGSITYWACRLILLTGTSSSLVLACGLISCFSFQSSSDRWKHFKNTKGSENWIFKNRSNVSTIKSMLFIQLC